MTSRAKRLTLILGVAALVAVIAGSVMVPQPAAAAKKLKDPTAFVLRATLKEEGWAQPGSGSFRSVGAIEDSGAARGSRAYLLVYGKRGDIRFKLNDPGWWEFTIVEGTGSYLGLAAQGTYTLTVRANGGGGGRPGDSSAHRKMDPVGSNTTYVFTLEGSVRE